MSKYKLTLPTLPDDCDFMRDSFWWKYRERFTAPMKFGWKIKPIAFEWFDREENRARLRGEQFPPKPIFRRVSPIPQPRDGKDGANSWTPRTGKE